MQNVLALAVPSPFELMVLLAMIVIPIAILFAVVFIAVKLAMKSKKPEDESQQS